MALPAKVFTALLPAARTSNEAFNNLDKNMSHIFDKLVHKLIFLRINPLKSISFSQLFRNYNLKIRTTEKLLRYLGNAVQFDSNELFAEKRAASK